MPDRPEDPNAIRCSCGSLLARRTERGIEVKCRRCRRVVLIVPDPKPESRGPPSRS
jgi:phage FluMu protein Com